MSSPYIRQLLDVIDLEEGAGQGHKKMVFEWMDTDLWTARPYGKLSHPKLPQIVAKSVLEALAVFQSIDAVYTGLFPLLGSVKECPGLD